LPLAILVYLYEQRKERRNEEDEVYQLLADNYQDFLKIALENPDLGLFSPVETGLAPAQKERRLIMFSMLVSLFERAFVLLYQERMSPEEKRRWSSWEDYMVEWCRRADFRGALPSLLPGEDPGFVKYIEKLAVGQASAAPTALR
jgi:hypothetical protein